MTDKLIERMRDFDRQMRPEFENTYVLGWADEVAALEDECAALVAHRNALEQRVEGYKDALDLMLGSPKARLEYCKEH
ncbi:hypothetical protein LCGC14_2091400, partial [marine sediment metagenome]